MLLLLDCFQPLLLLPRMVEVMKVDDHLPVVVQGICLPTCIHVLWERKGWCSGCVSPKNKTCVYVWGWGESKP